MFRSLRKLFGRKAAKPPVVMNYNALRAELYSRLNDLIAFAERNRLHITDIANLLADYSDFLRLRRATTAKL